MLDIEQLDLKYRSALISIGAIYEDHNEPMTPEMIEIAKRLIAERQEKTVTS